MRLCNKAQARSTLSHGEVPVQPHKPNCANKHNTQHTPHAQTCGVHAAAHHSADDVHQPRQLPLQHF